MVFEKARAKINLTLDVQHKRSDGYHEVEMVMQSVDFCDYLSLSPRSDTMIQIHSAALFMPTDDRNLAYRAAEVLHKQLGITRGVTIDIDKRIPISAGLGGGSADAAAVLRGLNTMWELGLSIEELQTIAAEIGSDVPFCIRGGTAVATGRGEMIETVQESPSLWVILAKPSVAVSTADVYSALDVEGIVYHPRAADMLQALHHASILEVAEIAGNVLEDVTLVMYPEVARVKEHMQRLGSQVTLMSGSGPTVFGLCEREQRAKRIYNAMKHLYKEVFLCQTC